MRRRPSAGGRAASAGVARALQECLAGGHALTYAELARAAACTERTVRNYVDAAAEAFGFEVERVRGSDHAMRVRRIGKPVRAAKIAELARALAGELLQNVFPISGTDLEPSKAPVSKLIVVSTRGAYQYSEHHLRVLRQWLQLATEEPRRAVRFRYDAAEHGIGDRIAWPMGMVLKDAARVYLAGVDATAADGRDVRTYALESVLFPPRGAAIEPLDVRTAGAPPPRFAQATIAEAIDAPFSIYRPSPGRSVHVRVAFGPKHARHVVNRRWHRRQRQTLTPDGGVVLEFGPADEGEVLAWLREWGDGAKLLELRPAKLSRKERTFQGA